MRYCIEGPIPVGRYRRELEALVPLKKTKQNKTRESCNGMVTPHLICMIKASKVLCSWTHLSVAVLLAASIKQQTASPSRLAYSLDLSWSTRCQPKVTSHLSLDAPRKRQGYGPLHTAHRLFTWRALQIQQTTAQNTAQDHVCDRSMPKYSHRQSSLC